MPGRLKARCTKAAGVLGQRHQCMVGKGGIFCRGIMHLSRRKAQKQKRTACMPSLAKFNQNTVSKSFLSIFLLLLSLCAGQPVPYSSFHPSGFCKGAKIVTMPHCTLQLPSIQLWEKKFTESEKCSFNKSDKYTWYDPAVHCSLNHPPSNFLLDSARNIYWNLLKLWILKIHCSMSSFDSYNHLLPLHADHCYHADPVSGCLINSDRSGLKIKATL